MIKPFTHSQIKQTSHCRLTEFSQRLPTLEYSTINTYIFISSIKYSPDFIYSISGELRWCRILNAIHRFPIPCQFAVTVLVLHKYVRRSKMELLRNTWCWIIFSSTSKTSRVILTIPIDAILPSNHCFIYLIYDKARNNQSSIRRLKS